MLAVLNRPIVTDYVPAAKPPWLLLAVVFGLVLMGLPRHLLPVVLAATGIAILAGTFVGWFWRSDATDELSPSVGPDYEQPADETPADEPSRRAA